MSNKKLLCLVFLIWLNTSHSASEQQTEESTESQQERPAPQTEKQKTPKKVFNYEPSEKIRADSAVTFPVDI